MSDLGGSCSCRINDDGPAVSSEKIVTARKKHICGECGEPIAPGEKYERVSGLWDGHWSRYKTCLPCSRIRDDLFTCFIYGELREMVLEDYGFDYVTGAQLTTGWWKGRN